MVTQPEIELTTSWSYIQRPDRYDTKQVPGAVE